MQIDLNKLKTFTIVAHYGEISAAARELGRTQPAITTQIKLLEEELGFNLFERRKGRILLTPQGKEINQFAQSQFNNIENFLSEFKEKQDEIKGLLRIGILDDQGNDFDLTDNIANFSKKYPLVDIEVLFGDNEQVEKWLIEDKVDLGISVIFKNDDYFNRYAIREDHHNLYASKQFLKKNKIKKIQDIFDYDILDLSDNFMTLRPWLSKNYPKNKFHLGEKRPKLVFTKFEQLAQILLKKEALAILPDYISSKNSRLERVFKSSKATVSGLEIAIRNHKTPRQCESEFIDFIV